MEFKPENVYYALNSTESLVGAEGYFANDVHDIICNCENELLHTYGKVLKVGKYAIKGIQEDETSIKWNCDFNFFYLVKPAPTKPKYRPFKDCNELIETYYKKLNHKIDTKLELPTIWVQDNKHKIAHSITDYDLGMNSLNCIKVNGDWEDLEFLFKYCNFLDGSPCGVEE